MKSLAALLLLLSLPSLALARSAQPMDPPVNLNQPYCEEIMASSSGPETIDVMQDCVTCLQQVANQKDKGNLRCVARPPSKVEFDPTSSTVVRL
jgi:hypothetical protein